MYLLRAKHLAFYILGIKRKPREAISFRQNLYLQARYLSRCPELEIVDFTDCEALSDAAAEHLARCPNLVGVHFGFRFLPFVANGRFAAQAALSSCWSPQNDELMNA